MSKMSVDHVTCVWDGEAFAPANQYWAARADKHYVIGQRYQMGIQEERSINSHRHYFSALKDAFDNLPMKWAGLFANVDHFRAWCLIHEGFRTERIITAGSPEDARKMATFAETMDPFAVVNVTGSVVTIWTAESQSMRAMKKERFQESKQAVLNRAASMIGVTGQELRENTGVAA